MSSAGIQGVRSRPAPLPARAKAAVVDISMMSLPVLVLATAAYMRMSGVPGPKLTTLFTLGSIATLMIGIAQVWLMGATGRSYGKLAMGLRVLRADGAKPSFGSVGVVRTLLMGLLWIGFPPFALLDVGVGVVRQDHRCLHDLLAGTVVVTA